jgi:MoaA/NifB/PqqE/SkfB family radical SAM enzyme
MSPYRENHNLLQIEKLRERATLLQNEHVNMLNDEDVVSEALELKRYFGVDWKYGYQFPSDFENYVRGWNASDDVLEKAKEEKSLLYLNMDLGYGCSLKCPHCFSMEGEIDKRGRKSLDYKRLLYQIREAKKIGLIAVRILGRGEPTEFRPMVDFIEFLHSEGIIPLIFTRGQVLGNDEHAKKIFKGYKGIHSGMDLVKKLAECEASVVLGYSSLFAEINDEMVGKIGHTPVNRLALKRLIEAGFADSNPTRLGVESPITNLNYKEMPVRFTFFQRLNVSPVMNVFMVTGRTQTLNCLELYDPNPDEYRDLYALITYMMWQMGINTRIGPYTGTKECHDVSNGLYLTLNGDVYPCPGYEGVHTILGETRTMSIREIWEHTAHAGQKQHICVPKIATHFPLNFERIIQERIETNNECYQQRFERIQTALSDALLDSEMNDSIAQTIDSVSGQFSQAESQGGMSNGFEQTNSCQSETKKKVHRHWINQSG